MDSSSSSSTVRRTAWISSSRHRSTVEEPERELSCLPPASTLDDNVFSDGCLPGNIENWLLRCGSKAGSEKDSQSSASKLDGEQFISEHGLAQHIALKDCGRPTSSIHQQRSSPSFLRFNHSIASSHVSSSSWKSSVTEVLELYSEDAEKTLSDLGFGWEEPEMAIRIPPRFLMFPSQAKGINFRLFLDSQLRRIREEDPSLSLASRFRQVQVLTEMANAFYSLYSHVSRTPLQKLESPEFSFSSSTVERIERFRNSSRHEPRSPVERLKDTVNKMCLYTSPRVSESTSPQPSPRKECCSPEVVDFPLAFRPEAEKKRNLGELYLNISAGDVELAEDSHLSDIQTKKWMMQDSIIAGHQVISENLVRQSNLDNMVESVRTFGNFSSEKNLMSTEQYFSSRTAELKPVTKVASDLFFSQRASICCQNTHILSGIPSEAGSKDTSCPACPFQHNGDECRTEGAPTREAALVDSSELSFDLQRYNSRDPLCTITVSDWEGDSMNASQRCEVELLEVEGQYLLPLAHQDQGHVSKSMQQVPSFEMEEVQSAGEEDFGQTETSRASLSMKLVRGDSMQSDSSGYADEEICPSPERQ
ncbi:uncharacterized protein tespa1 isoform X2 [Gouania willdenowi]|uniref:uncharacterized protein tespa1 isoform X2 n=1 Tax=Gouania willdenowi TaxID=441366 RepID=UPI0010546D01|nr:protein TESPA1 isoform X2 [Gouania willdenowi]